MEARVYVISDGIKSAQIERKEVSKKVIEKEKQIIENFAVVIPKLSEEDKSYLLGLGEGMAMRVDKDEKKRNENEEK